MIVKSRKSSGGEKLGGNKQHTNSKSVSENVHTEVKGRLSLLDREGRGTRLVLHIDYSAIQHVLPRNIEYRSQGHQ